jgi:hypothetical protein
MRRTEVAFMTSASYRECVVTFFDMLGFSEMVRKAAPEEILSHVRVFQDTGRVDDDLGEVLEARSFQFSDCIVRVTPIDSASNRETPGGLLFHEILHIVHAQMEMARRGVYVRGGVTVGNMYFSGSEMFGPAMLKAYALESKMAIYPRVVVDPLLVERMKTDPLLRKDTNSGDGESRFVKPLLLRDADGLWFVDFLRSAESEVDHPALYDELLSMHKAAVESRLAACPVVDSLAQKSLWAATYHNGVLDRLVVDGHDAGRLSQYRVEVPARLHGTMG